MKSSLPGYVPQGVVPAVLLPFNQDLSIDEASYRRHLDDLASVSGVTALTINGHSAEIHTLSFEEQQRALEITVDQVGDKLPVICGVYTESTLQAQRIARMAKAGGASCLLAFPPAVLMFRGEDRPEVFVDYYKALGDATDLPIVLFQFPKWTGLQLSMDTLVKACETVPTIVAIKDLCSDPALHEMQIRTLHALARPVNVMTTHSSWLMGSLAMGARGIISGAGSVIADLQVALFDAYQKGDMPKAAQVGERVYAAVQAFYAKPYIDWQARMKTALVLCGRLPNALVRPPLKAIDDAERARLSHWLGKAGLTSDTVYRNT
ncbi:MAG TPA: dihydrodipicolinate synthase family protein [Castellaniella sp.]|uniref:dihydrodipicolinate synthase family protein n=1 Tax=Castellaniella sp. TaxID=1955812 RepID=UPI002EEE2058